jgi:hypothetical protein
VAVAAPLRRSDHPRAIGAENQIAHVHALGLRRWSDAPAWRASLQGLPRRDQPSCFRSSLRAAEGLVLVPGGLRMGAALLSRFAVQAETRAFGHQTVGPSLPCSRHPARLRYSRELIGSWLLSSV